MESTQPRWLPLESNPEVMNNYMGNLGVDMSVFEYTDVYGFEPDLLMMIPRPVVALVLLFPITENYEKFRLEEEEKIKKDGQVVSDEVYFTKQTVGNACGTVGIIHVVANNMERFTFKEDSPLKDFIENTKSLSPQEKAVKLGSHKGVTSCHSNSAQEGQTKAPSVDTKIDLHFIALVKKDGHLYELDGRKPFPINHGKTSEETFLEDSAAVCQTFMKRDPDNYNFNMIALAQRAF